MAHDKNGDCVAVSAALGIKLDKSLTNEEYTELHLKLVNAIAEDFKIDTQYITPISEEEYYTHADVEGDEDE